MTTTNLPSPASEVPLIPVRMLNEYVYCPRLAYLMWVQGEFEHNAYTVEGVIRHRRVEKKSGKLPEEPVEEEKVHAQAMHGFGEHLQLSVFQCRLAPASLKPARRRQ